jgi:hypothetical protein
MKYDHMVKYKGVYYPTGANVPVEEIKPKEEPKEPVKKGK